MATIKTIEYHCPHCNKKLRTSPYGDHCSVKMKLYGNPREVCPRCENSYFNPMLTEAALDLTLAEKVPFLLTGTRTLVAEIIIAIFCVVIAIYGAPGALLGVLIVALFHLLLSAATRPYRQKHKNKVLIASRMRIKEDVQYFIELVARTPMPQVNKANLKPMDIMLMHQVVCAEMDKDRPLRLEAIALDVQNRTA